MDIADIIIKSMPYTALGWRDVEHIEPRVNTYSLHRLQGIIDSVNRSTDDSSLTSEKPGSAGTQQTNPSPPNQRKSSTAAPLMRGLKGLFSSSFKFQKSLKR